MARTKRQQEIPQAEKPKIEDIDDELVVEVQQLTEAWQKQKADSERKRALLLEQMRAAGFDEYETHDGYTVAMRHGKDKISVRKPAE